MTAGTRRKRRAGAAVWLVLCMVCGALLLVNLALLVRSGLKPERPPSLFGLTPLTVLSGSMSGDAEGHLEVGDLAIIREAEPGTLRVGDVVAYMSGGSTVTHRITAIDRAEDGSLLFTTKGDANNAEDTSPVPESDILGLCTGRLAGLGSFVLFLRRPLGLALFGGLPLAALLGWELVDRRRRAEAERRERRRLKAELRRAQSCVQPEPGSYELEDILSAKY